MWFVVCKKRPFLGWMVKDKDRILQRTSTSHPVPCDDLCVMLCFVFLMLFRMEDEAVLDRGASFVKHICDEEEVEGKATFAL